MNIKSFQFVDLRQGNKMKEGNDGKKMSRYVTIKE